MTVGEGINPLNVALVSMDNITHCLQVHMNVLLIVNFGKLMISLVQIH